MDEPFKISMEEIAIILNNLYIQGINRVSVEYPFLEMPLVEIDLDSFKIEIKVDKKKFEKKENRRHSSVDLATYKNFFDSLIVSGVLPFRNTEEVERLFSIKLEEYVKPFFNPTAIFVGIDTNIAYYNAISNFFTFDKFGYAISQIVLKEIDSRIHEKYSPNDISHFEKLPYGKYAKYFINGSVKESRIAKIALAEIFWMEKNLKTLRIKNDNFPADKELRDKLIVESYCNFAKQHGIEMIVLSTDKDFVFHAQTSGISSIHLELPHELSTIIQTTFYRMLKLIYVFTVVMGLIKIEDNLLLGEYPGKTGDDYINKNIGCLTKNKEILKDVYVCRRWYNES